jgi:hypothetical protein
MSMQSATRRIEDRRRKIGWALRWRQRDWIRFLSGVIGGKIAV